MNMIHSCALYIRAGNSDEQMEFVNCQMEMPFVTDPTSQIVREYFDEIFDK